MKKPNKYKVMRKLLRDILLDMNLLHVYKNKVFKDKKKYNRKIKHKDNGNNRTKTTNI